MDKEKLSIRPITFNIYASDDDEAERGRKAIIEFINTMGRHGARVSGDKLALAVSKMEKATFVTREIIKFFKD